MPELRSNRGQRTDSVLDKGVGDCEFCTARQVPVLYFDTSDEEYGWGHVCHPCIQKLFEEVQVAQA